MFRAYRIALKCDILNQHFTSCARNKMGKSMFFNNIKTARFLPVNAVASSADENIFSQRQRLLLIKVKSIKRLSADKNESLLTFMQNNIL